MIAYVKGTLAEKSPYRVIVDVGGVGYEVFIPLSTFDRLPAAGEGVKIFTYHCVREDAQLLYGFATEREREMFELVTTVSGVGCSGRNVWRSRANWSGWACTPSSCPPASSARRRWR